MTPQLVEFLQSPIGEQWLHEIQTITEQNQLQIATRLRQHIPPEQVHAVMETALLRQKAKKKFSRANQMFFTRPALEQASGELIAHYRAQRFAGLTTLADLGCSIGGDAIALAKQADVIGIDLDATRLAMAEVNLAVYGLANQFKTQQADIQTLPLLPVQGCFLDPARREANGRRIHSIHQYKPPFSEVMRWIKAIGQVGVKISPRVAYDELPPNCEVEFISVNGELKEAVLWFGQLRTATRRATLLPDDVTLTAPAEEPTLPLSQPKQYLYEPDAAVIRAHLVTTLGQTLNATLLDEQIAYLTSDKWHKTAFATAYHILDVFPFQLKRLRQYLRERRVGTIIIKKRGSPIDPDWLRKQLKLKGNQPALIFLTQQQNNPIVIVARRTL